jgi:hypothetical protein
MPYFLRAIYSNIQWDETQFPSWLKEGDLPSCIIRDLRADDNALSLWEIPDDKSNLLDVSAALASLRSNMKQDFDYALLNAQYLDELTFPPSKQPATTPYRDINHYHRNVPKLSLNSVVRFAHLLSKHGQFDRIGWKHISARLKRANSNGQLDLTKMRANLKKQLDIIQ